jgi:glycosyltransferase involved in cell wall biosynthesis
MIANLYMGLDLSLWEQAGRRGERPGLGPYGVEHLARQGLTLTHWNEPGWTRAPGIREYHNLERRIRLPLVRTTFSHRSVRRADVALAILEQEGYAHALLKRQRMSPWSATPLALLSCWLADTARTANRIKLDCLRLISQGADLLIFWSRNQRQIFRERLEVPDDRLFFVPFGIETEFYLPQPYLPKPGSDGNYILAVGNDPGRDFQTFLTAVANIDYPVKIACRQERLVGLDIPSNVEVLGEVDHLHYRELLYGSAVVVIPTKPATVYPTGQTVLLNAMSCQRPTVVTATAAMADYIRHGENTWSVAGEDPVALRDGIEQILSDDARAQKVAEGGRADVERVFNAETMWASIAQRLRDLVNR